MKKEVVVTGMGVVTPIGNNIEEFRAALREGTSGEGKITRYDGRNFSVKKACEVKGFRPGWRTKILDPFIQYAFHSANEAVIDSGLNISEIDPYRVGIVLGASKGGLVTYHNFRQKYGQYLPSALHTAAFYASFPPHIGSQWLAKRYGVMGPTKCYSTACATGTYSLIEGARMIEEGEVDYCLAGASDASITPLVLAGYKNMKVYSRKGRMCPYDKHRDGFLVGEGAGMVVLESKESAKARGVPYYAAVAASSYGTDGVSLLEYSHEAHGLSRLIEKALRQGGLTVKDIDYINTHGTSTQNGDRYEVNELKHALKAMSGQIPMSSTKSMTGHMVGASGAVEFITCCLAIKEKWVHPTIHLTDPDPQCDLDFVPKQIRQVDVKIAVSFSLAFGGHMGVIVLKE